MNNRKMKHEDIAQVELFDICNHLRTYVFGLDEGNTGKEIMFQQALSG